MYMYIIYIYYIYIKPRFIHASSHRVKLFSFFSLLCLCFFHWSAFYRAVRLSIPLRSSATGPKNTLLTPAVLHPACPCVIKHVCWDTRSLSLSLSGRLHWWHKQSSWSILQLEEDKQICCFLSMTSQVSQNKAQTDVHIGPHGTRPHSPKLAPGSPLHLLSSRQASYKEENTLYSWILSMIFCLILADFYMSVPSKCLLSLCSFCYKYHSYLGTKRQLYFC